MEDSILYVGRPPYVGPSQFCTSWEESLTSLLRMCVLSGLAYSHIEDLGTLNSEFLSHNTSN